LTPSPLIFSCSSRRAASALLAAVAVAVIAASCGGNAPSSGTSSSDLAAAGAKKGPGQAAFQFSACMRHHGVSNFPDPKVKSSAGGTSVAIGINPAISGQPAFKSAQKACQHIIGSSPGTGPGDSPAQRQAKTRAMIAFARCLRDHGFPNFPDPDATGQLSEEMIRRSGINFQTPALLTAGRSCASVTHGLITPAQVAEAINHAKQESSQTNTAP
jgi:hypothetical protein